MTRAAGFKRRVRARMTRTGESYSAARAHLDRGGAGQRVLHVTAGDSVTGTLRGAGVAGRVLTWADMLHDGPVPAAAPSDLWRIRAEHLASRGWADSATVERQFADREVQLGSRTHREYVLWFDADLYDQLLLLQVIDALRRLGVEPERSALISVGEQRGVAHFGGLGELTAEQLTSLVDQATLLSLESFDVAAAAWVALRSPEPSGLARIAGARSPALRFLGEAFGRVRQEYPSRTDGLSLTQRRILLAAAAGDSTAGAVFRTIWQQERRPYLSNLAFDACVRELAECQVPLLAIEGQSLRVTGAGHDVLDGRADHVRLSGIDRWIGGVHLVGRAPSWRYDERLESLVPG